MYKIGILGPFYPFRGGISNFNYHLYKELSKNYRVFALNYIKLYPKIIFPGKTQYNYKDSPFKMDSIKIFNPQNPFSWNSCAKEILHLDLDHLIVPYWSPIFGIQLGFILKRLKVKKPELNVIAICHNILPHEKIPLQSKIFQYFIKNVDQVVRHSSKEMEKLKKLSPHKKCLKLFHPIYEGFFNEELTKKDACEILKIPVRKNLLFFGHIRKYKGLNILLNTIPLLPKDFFLIIAGEFYEKKEKYLDLIDKLNLKKRIKIFDRYIPDEEIYLYFNASDVVVLPYISCTQSGIIPLAYHFNKGVIASHTGGIPEVVEDGKSGVLFKEGDEISLKKAILEFFSKKVEIESFVKEYKKKFSWKYYTEKLISG